MKVLFLFLLSVSITQAAKSEERYECKSKKNQMNQFSAVKKTVDDREVIVGLIHDGFHHVDLLCVPAGETRDDLACTGFVYNSHVAHVPLIQVRYYPDGVTHQLKLTHNLAGGTTWECQ